MLVLTRGQDQSIVIDGKIRVTVLSVKGGKIRLGISAPDDVRVDREEVHTRLVEAGFSDQPLIIIINQAAHQSICRREPSPRICHSEE
jgi:carbon storage regulator